MGVHERCDGVTHHQYVRFSMRRERSPDKYEHRDGQQSESRPIFAILGLIQDEPDKLAGATRSVRGGTMHELLEVRDLT